MEHGQDSFEAKERGRRGGGGKLSRSETVTVRLDPKLNYLCELAARAQRRTKSSFIEWAVEQSLAQTWVPGASDWNGSPQSIGELADRLWDVDEPDRLANIAFVAPTLMTHEEQVLWKVVCNYTYLWRGRWASNSPFQEEWRYEIKADSLIHDRLREHFEQLKSVARGETSVERLPCYEKRRPKRPTPPVETDFDDSDVPF